MSADNSGNLWAVGPRWGSSQLELSPDRYGTGSEPVNRDPTRPDPRTLLTRRPDPVTECLCFELRDYYKSIFRRQVHRFETETA